MRDLLMRHLNIYINFPLLYTYTVKNIHLGYFEKETEVIIKYFF